MAVKKYLQINASGVPQEDNVNIILATELAASTGAALVGVDDTSFVDIAGTDLQTVLESIDTAIGAAGDVDSVNGQTGVVVLDGGDIDSTHTATNYTPANATIDGHLSGIDTELGNIFSSISSPFNYKGAFDASAGDFTAISPASVGDWYKVTVAGTIGSVTYDVGDNIVINKDVAGTVVSADVDKVDNTDQVTSVNGFQGVIVLSSDDLDSDATLANATPAGNTITDHLEALDAEIGTNATDIATNASNISTNTTNIATNASDISALDTRVTTNEADIATNTTNIATNTSNISTNTANIATNTADIATNAADIATNSADIAKALKGDILEGFVAGEALAAGDPVYKSSATEVSKASASDDTALEVIGIAAAATTLGNPVDVIVFGPATGLSGLTATSPVFLAEGGGLTETIPTTSGAYVLRIGKATGTTTMDVEPKNTPMKLA